MIERHYFGDKLLKSFDFNFGFCVPNSRNTIEHIYQFPALTDEQSKYSALKPINYFIQLNLLFFPHSSWRNNSKSLLNQI